MVTFRSSPRLSQSNRASPDVCAYIRPSANIVLHVFDSSEMWYVGKGQ